MRNELKNKLEKLHEKWRAEKTGLDANCVTVFFPSNEWRKARSEGAKKECGRWVLWSGSVNSAGSDFAGEVQKIASSYGLITSEYQL